MALMFGKPAGVNAKGGALKSESTPLAVWPSAVVLPDRRRKCSPGVSGESKHWAVAVGGVADQHGLSRGHLYALSAVVA